MTSPTRRTFFKAAGVGAAAVGAAAVSAPAASAAAAPAAIPAAVPAAVPELKLPAAAKGSLVAYITDVASGEISVMVEGHEVTVHDPQLVAKLAHVLHSQHAV